MKSEKIKSKKNYTMEDQHKYQAAKWQPWRVKQLQELSTVFENATLEGWKKIAADSEFAELDWKELYAKIMQGGGYTNYTGMGYWIAFIGGPKNYTAFALHKTPYSAPLFVIERDYDVLEKETAEEAEGTDFKGPLMCLGLKGGDQ